MKFTWILSVTVVFCYLAVFSTVSIRIFISRWVQFTIFFIDINSSRSSDQCYPMENLYMNLKLFATEEETQFDRISLVLHHKTSVVGWLVGWYNNSRP